VCAQQSARTREVVVVDSGSTDRTAAIAAEFPVRLLQIRADEFHHGRTRNAAARLTGGSFLVYLSADAFPMEHTWLESLLAPFLDPAVGAVYGRQQAKPEATPERRFFMEHRYGTNPPAPSRDGAVGQYRTFQFSTVNCAIRRLAWQKLPFPEDLNAYEDFSWAIQASKNWHLRYEPNAAVLHSHNYPLLKSFQQYFDNGVVHEMRGLADRAEVAQLRSDGVQYLREEVRFLIGAGAAHRVPYVLLYEAARYCGLALGRRHRSLPMWAKRRFSSHRLFP